MTPDDAQIDVLMRRYARQAEAGPAAEHLDADELNAFAEGSLPPAARSSYVSHLADCADCRKLATKLTIAVGATRGEAAGSIQVGTESLWQKLTTFFAAPTVRYAAFAAVLIAAGGIVFLSTRQSRDRASLVAQNESRDQTPVSAVKPGEVAPSPPQSASNFNDREGTASAPARSSLDQKQDQFKAGKNPAATPGPDKDLADSTSPGLAAKKAAEPVVEEKSQPYAPQPPASSETERSAESRSRVQRDERGVLTASGPRKGESPSDKLKTMDRSRAVDMPKDSRGADDNISTRNQQAVQNRVEQQRAAGPRSNSQVFGVRENDRNAGAAGTATTSAGRADAEKAPETRKPAETRSVGGHKFRKQGSAWVDSKFKSSMSVTNISRGSDDFRALDSALRSMADQLAGEVIVVSKGKAYRIR